MTATNGRPRVYTEQVDPLKVASVRLSNWHLRKARRLGGGSLSEGVRIALEKVEARMDVPVLIQLAKTLDKDLCSKIEGLEALQLTLHKSLPIEDQMFLSEHIANLNSFLSSEVGITSLRICIDDFRQFVGK